MTALLKNVLIDRIKASGAISVYDFMRLALEAYYKNEVVFGVEGDFITAPEISQIFGEMIGLWAAAVWRNNGGGEAVNIIEFGAGRGTLMADFMRASKQLPEFYQSISIDLVETSPSLREVQKKALAEYEGRVFWHDDISSLPRDEGVAAIILANEFFDALPIEQAIYDGEKWLRRVVKFDDDKGEFYFDIGGEFGEVKGAFGGAKGDLYEYSPMGRDIAGEMGEYLAEFGGVALVIDYGHVESGFGDTLQAVGGHEFVPVLENVGKVDLTSHVDFEDLGNAFGDDIRVFSVIEQGAFLKALGADIRAKILCSGKSEVVSRSIMEGANRLMDSDKMGRLFKVMCVANKEWDELPLFGFEE